MKLSYLLAPCAALAFALPTAAQDDYVRLDGQWHRLYKGQTFLVDNSVVSARFAEGLGGLDGMLELLGDDAGALAGLTVVRSNRLGIVDMALPQGADAVDIVRLLRATGLVVDAEVSTFGSYVGVPNDTQFSTQWNLNNTGQSGGVADADVDAPEAWDLTGGDPSIVVAVIDSGTEYFHPDLQGNIWSNPGEIPANGQDDDNNGFVDDIQGWDFELNDNTPNSNFYHGTAVAGVIGAVGNNNTQIAGLAGGGDTGSPGCSVMPMRVGENAPISAILDDAILYALDNGAHVVTLSLTVPQDGFIDAAISSAYAGGVFIDCAAGNGLFGSSPVTYPALLPDVMAVASTNRSDIQSSFSNQGPEIEVAAPGEQILMLNLNGGTTTSDGTSFSAPHVAALAGLILSVNPALNNVQVRQLIMDSADDVMGPGFDQQTGWGRINAATAVAVAAGGTVGTATLYGSALPGGNGLDPLIATIGNDAPTVGDAGFGMTVRNAAGGALAFLALSDGQASLPFKGGLLLVDPGATFFTIPATTSPSGSAAVGLPVPNDPLFEGVEFYAQWLIQDAGAVAGWAMSAGLDCIIGS